MDIQSVFENEGGAQEETQEIEVGSDAIQEGEAQEDVQEETVTPAVESETEEWTKSAVLAERKKRQNLEREIERMKAETGKDVSAEDEPDLIDDPDGFKMSMERKMSDKLLNMSVALMRDSHEDFDEMADHFVELAKEDSTLGDKMRSSANPAKFAYDYAKKNLEFEKVTAPDYIDNLKKQLREEIMQEMEVEKPRKAVHNLVKSVQKGSNSSAVSKVGLDDVFADSHF